MKIFSTLKKYFFKAFFLLLYFPHLFADGVRSQKEKGGTSAFGENVYDMVINEGLKGKIGTLIVIVIIVTAAFLLTKNLQQALIAIVAAIFFAGAVPLATYIMDHAG